MHVHTWDYLNIPNMNCERGKLNWLVEGKLEEMPFTIKVIQTARRVRLRDPLLESSSPSSTVLFSYNKYLTCSTTYFLCGNSFLQSWRPGPLSLTTGLLARLWCSHRCNPTSISGWEPQPFWELLQAEIPEVTLTRDPPNIPALQGGFLTTGPPEKSLIILSLTWCLHS